jgi:hypothetical protein
MKTNRLTLAANDGGAAILANAAEGGSPFAILQPDGFLIPYGEFPHKVGLQVFDKTAAEKMVANHNGLFSKVVSWARGKGTSYPVYVGHPDLPGSKDTDKRAYGWIEGMAAENDGLRLSVKWSEAGRELVENAHFKFYSPLWWTEPVKRGVVRPVSLKSMGLTNDPNIPVPALANEYDETQDGETQDTREESQDDETNDTDMKELLAALGLEDGATAEDALAKIASLKEAAEAAANAEKPEGYEDPEKLKADKLQAEEDKAKAEEMKTEAENSLAEANTKIVTLETFLTAAANAAVDGAVKAGRILPADKDAKVTEILAANDFAAALQDLGKLDAKFKTETTVGNLGADKSKLVLATNDAAAAAKNERAQLVENEFQNTNHALSTGERKRIAWQRAQKKNPEIFGKKDSSGTDA